MGVRVCPQRGVASSAVIAKGAAASQRKSLDAIAAEQIRGEAAHGNNRQSALEDCLEELHVRQRMLLQRCYTGDEPIRQIAAEIGVSPAALTMRLQRIRHALVRCIDQALSKVEAVS